MRMLYNTAIIFKAFWQSRKTFYSPKYGNRTNFQNAEVLIGSDDGQSKKIIALHNTLLLSPKSFLVCIYLMH